jgi:sugar phosphate isomerase/epimerase
MAAKKSGSAKRPFGCALNTSTIRGFKLGIVKEIELASKAGYEGIEPWIAEIEEYQKGGGSLKDLGKRLADAGVKVVGAIAFPEWADENESVRRAALEKARREMDMVRQIGGSAIAAPPRGNVANVGLDLMAECCAKLVDVGKAAGVTPLLELWGHAPKLSRLGELMYVAYESKSGDVKLLLDVYHLYKGGNSFESLRLLNGAHLGLLHMNDYPADPPRATIADKDRIFPGDGVAPLGRILSILREIGYRGMLSLELFNPKYWEGDPAEIVRVGLEKTKAIVAAVG